MHERWYSGTSRGQWLALAAALLGWAFDGFEQGVFPLVARPALTELLGLSEQARMAREMREQADKEPDGEKRDEAKAAAAKAEALVSEPVRQWNGVMAMAYLLGAASGGVFFGWLGDRIGRVRAMVFSVLTYALFTGACGLAATAWQLGLLRLFASMGMGGEWSLGVALVMESWPTRSRPVLAGLIGAAANVGFLVVALLALLIVPDKLWPVAEFFTFLPGARTGSQGSEIGAWRILLVMCVLPALLTFLLRTFVPESKRWEHAVATGPRARVADIFVPALRSRSLMGAALGAVALLATWGAVQWIPLWIPQLTREAGAATRSQIFLACGAILGTFLAAVVGSRVPRRVMYFGLCLSSLLLSEFLFLSLDQFDVLFKVTIFLVGALTASFYGWLPLYLPELFPTRVRATGQGFSFNAGRVLAALGVVVTTFAINLQGRFALAGALVCSVYVVGLILAWFLPETRDKPLPE